MNEEEKFTETETSATETVAESPEITDNVVADSQVSPTSGEDSTKEVVTATEKVAKSQEDPDMVYADSLAAPAKKTFKDTIKFAFTKDEAKSNAKKLANRWFIDAFTGMAQGLFVTLIAGTILKQIGKLFGEASGFGALLIVIGNLACTLMGAGIGVGIAKKLKVPDMLIFACAAAGFIGAFLPDALYKSMTALGHIDLNAVAVGLKPGLPGNPIGAYVGTLLALELVRLYAGKTKLDILLVPLGVLFLCFINMFLSIPAIWLVKEIGVGIELAVHVAPFVMGVIISVVVGLLLTMPTSSAAIWLTIAATAPANSYEMLLAGGAATVGCACQMVGFAFASFKENRYSGLISQGVGTSMLQIPNIMKNGRILIPATVAAAICGPMSTCLFKLRCNAAGGGMGTSGFVGIFGILDASTIETVDKTGAVVGALEPWIMWLGIILLMVVLPALISWGMSVLLRKVGWIKDGDMSLDYDKKYK